MSAATVQQALDLALSDLRAGRLQAVEANCRQILAKFPDQPDAMHMLAVVAHRVGRTDVAIDLLRRAVAVAPSHLEILRTLGSILITSGNFEPAIVFFGQAVRIAPNDAEILNNLGTALQETGQIQSAAEAFSRAVACQPEMAEAHLNLGGACAAAGDIKKAVDCFRRALAINPDLVPALNNLGTALMELDDFDGAVSLLERAVEVDPNLPQAHNNLGLALDHQNQPDRAIAEFQHAIALQPQYAEAHNNLGTVLMNIGDPSAAATEFANALKASPRHAVAHSNFIYSLNFSPDTTPHRILEEQKKWEQLQTKREWVDGRKFSNDRSRDRRLRVGLVSADFREHVAGWNLLPILREHDRQKLALICYSNLKNPDVMTERMRGEVEGWRSIAGMEDGRAVEMLVGDQIDVLIDLSMHSAGNRLGVFARRAAPVQMTYLGYCGSTGLSTMDYRLSDPYLDDAQTEKDYVEKTLYLPQTYWCYSPGGEVPEVSEPPMKRKGYITFGCLNNFAKMSVWVQELWSRILREVKGSHLLLHSQPGSHVDELKSRFESWGISSDRLEIVAKQRWEQYMNSYSQIDICLDPSPYGGGITTCDALMMGVGVVTVVGRLPVSRAGKSILSNVGLKELIAKDAEEYVKIATELALDETRLTELRRTLRDRLKASPLMDAPRFTRALESLIKQAWNVWIESEARS